MAGDRGQPRPNRLEGRSVRQWLDPELNWIGADLSELRDKLKRILEYLGKIRSPKATNAALERLFAATLNDMLRTALGEAADEFWANYRRVADIRNTIIHKGNRVWYRTIEVQQSTVQRDQILSASVHFAPECWVVFSRLWNEYIHKPMLAKAPPAQALQANH